VDRLAWDAATGLRWAQFLADLRRAGAAMPVKDSLIAATALQHGLTFVTRDVRDFRKAKVKVLDPFA
jgi:predicted nucleic acid-binding protein